MRLMHVTVAKSFHTWCNECARQVQVRRRILQATRLWSGDVMVRCVLRWRDATRVSVDERGKIVRALQSCERRNTRMLVKHFYSWRDVCMQGGRRRRLCGNALKMWFHGTLARALERWQELAVFLKHARAVCLRDIQRSRQSLLVQMFNTWKRAPDQSFQAQVSCMKVLTRVFASQKTSVFAAWRSYTVKRMMHARASHAIYTRHFWLVMTHSVAAWADYVKAIIGLKIICLRIVLRWRRWVAWEAFMTWFARTARARSAKRVHRKYLWGLKTRSMDAWLWVSKDQGTCRRVGGLARELLKRERKEAYAMWVAEAGQLLTMKLRSRWSYTGDGIKRFRKAVRRVMMARRFLACACRVGISIANDPPHTVLSVTELMDTRGVLQGEPGYSNAHVHKGDVLVQIDGVSATHLGIVGVKDALFGPPNSVVVLWFERSNGTQYQVRYPHVHV